jgi:hypothetical protein
MYTGVSECLLRVVLQNGAVCWWRKDSRKTVYIAEGNAASNVSKNSMRFGLSCSLCLVFCGRRTHLGQATIIVFTCSLRYICLLEWNERPVFRIFRSFWLISRVIAILDNGGMMVGFQSSLLMICTSLFEYSSFRSVVCC